VTGKPDTRANLLAEAANVMRNMLQTTTRGGASDMSQLESLTAFITANLPPDAMQMFSSSMDDCELVRKRQSAGKQPAPHRRADV
jgi:hypothetical protein